MISKEFKKYTVTSLSNVFEEATVLQTISFQSLLDNLQEHQVIVKNLYAGINASDINYTAGRYDATKKPPFDPGFEAIGIVVAVGSKANIPLDFPVANM